MRLARFLRPLSRVFVGALVFLVGASSAALAQGTITGRVTAEGTNEPLGEARVLVVGANASATSAQNGNYTLNGVRNGTVEVQVLRVGYNTVKKQVAVTAGGTTTVDFSMSVAVVKLQDVVTTATGEQRKVELGHAVATINATQVLQDSPIRDMQDLLIAKTPGLTITPGNYTGAGAQIRIRGLSSIGNSGPPIFILDGIRMDAGGGVGLTGGGASTSRLNDISPEEIEDIEIVKGPSAATLYGTNAANGVVVITTKRGRSGNTSWNYGVEYGTLDDRNAYQNTWANWGHLPGGTAAARCFLWTIADKSCISDSLTSANILKDPTLSPIKLGYRNLKTMQVSGGTELVRFFTSATLENEIGALKMPQIFTDQLISKNIPVRPEFIRPSLSQRESFRANLNTAVSPKFDLSSSVLFFKTDQRGAQSDNNVNSYYYNALTNPGFVHAGLGFSNVGNLGQDLHGYGGFTPAEIFQSYSNEDIQRLGANATATWRPLPWLQNEATTGVDIVNADNVSHCFLDECANFSTQRQGSFSESHSNGRNFTAKITSKATWNPRSYAAFQTSGGADYLNNESESTSANANSPLGPGVQSIAPALNRSGSNGAPTATKTLGYYVQEQLGLRDRIFLTAAIRADQNSAFGSKFQYAYYPKYSLSWLLSDEPFFVNHNPRGFIDQFRLRGAYGASGIQPGATTALKTFSSSTVNVAGVDVPALSQGAIGNANLRPERSMEYEGGFDLHVAKNRVIFEFTYYSKQTTDALESYSYAPSAGASSSITRNLGGVKNAGAEVTMTTTLVDTKAFAWDVTVGGSHNKNKVTYLGADDAGKPLPASARTSTSRTVPGYPLGSVWYQPFTWHDDNGDGIIVASEVHVTDPAKGDSAQYVGPAFPTDNANISMGFDLFQRKLRVTALANYQGGFQKFNNTMSFLCQQTVACFTNENPAATTADQARQIAQDVVAGARTGRGYSENLNFWRLREINAQWRLPDQVAKGWLRSPGATLQFGVRNVHVWSSYAGEDPEANYSTGNSQTDLLTKGPDTIFSLRLNLKY